MAKSAGNTIVVAGGGGAGGSRGGGGSDNGGGSSSKTKISNGKLKLDDNMFYTLLGGAVAIFAVVHLYQQNPSLFHGFIDPLRNLVSGQPTIPAAPPGTTQNDIIPQQPAGVAPAPEQGQWGGQMQYPTYPQAPTGQQQFQMPGQPQYPQQYQGYSPQGDQFGGAGGGTDAGQFQTQYNPVFGQNSNVQSFRAVDYSSKDGMLTIV